MKWWNEPSAWERFTEPFRDPNTVSDGAIVLLVMIAMGILGLCVAFL